MSNKAATLIPRIQDILYRHFGPLNWWPADHPFEVAVGAILTQNTAWTNVEYAIANLKEAGAMSPVEIANAPMDQLEKLIRPSGFYRQKARRLKKFAEHLVHMWQGDIVTLCSGPLEEARNRLLALDGIGPETADSILLYAAKRESFVVDAYTRRIFERLGLLHGSEHYGEVQKLFMQHLAKDVSIYNEYHAQVVNLAKQFCKKSRPVCEFCPVREHCCHTLDS